MTLPIVEETHQHGMLTLENLDMIMGMHGLGELLDCRVGIQTHSDGRIWLCVNGIAFIRFKPLMFHTDGDPDSPWRRPE